MSSTNFQKLNRIRLGLIMAKCLFLTLSWFEWALYRLHSLNVTIFMTFAIKAKYRANQGLSQSEPKILDNCSKSGQFGVPIKIVTFKLWSRLRAHSNQLNAKNKHFAIINLSRIRFNFWKFVDDIPVDRNFFQNFFSRYLDFTEKSFHLSR